MKRSLSPAGSPLSKRRWQGPHPLSSPRRSAEVFPSVEEVVYQIFSYLDAVDLCTIQCAYCGFQILPAASLNAVCLSAVSTFWCRLAADNQLWKALFTAKHPLNRLRGGRGSYARAVPDGASGREIRSLPHRASSLHAHRQDWKWMYR